jgi:hypothetical protein
MDAEPNLDPVLAAVGAVLAGETGAAEGLRSMWDADGPAWDRCVIAHYLADTETDPAGAQTWDELALAAAEEIPAGDVGRFGFSREQMLPSLHLNIAANLLELGDPAAAREQLASVRLHLHRLDEAAGRSAADSDGASSGYAATIRGGLERLELRAGGHT